MEENPSVRDFVEINSASSSSTNVHRVARGSLTKDLKDIWLCRIDVHSHGHSFISQVLALAQNLVHHKNETHYHSCQLGFTYLFLWSALGNKCCVVLQLKQRFCYCYQLLIFKAHPDLG